MFVVRTIQQSVAKDVAKNHFSIHASTYLYTCANKYHLPFIVVHIIVFHISYTDAYIHFMYPTYAFSPPLLYVVQVFAACLFLFETYVPMASFPSQIVRIANSFARLTYQRRLGSDDALRKSGRPFYFFFDVPIFQYLSSFIVDYPKFFSKYSRENALYRKPTSSYASRRVRLVRACHLAGKCSSFRVNVSYSTVVTNVRVVLTTMRNLNPIGVKNFYGTCTLAKQEIVENRLDDKQRWVKKSRKMPSNILGPPEFWMEFYKQADALGVAFDKSTDFQMLCTFVYQRENGFRKFVVADPERYWWHYEHRPAEKRCSYEIIPEHHPCRLYLDLEYSIELNGKSDGPSMTDTIIDVFSAYLLAYWHVPCNKYNVINLDSSTNEKFSRHLVFNLKDVAFKDNYHVGRLVKSICQDILDYVSLDAKSHDILCNFDKRKLEGLIVETSKDKRLFVDTAVYTKNRHFRIYKSTKWGKKSNLIISNDSKYIPSNLSKDKELNIFLDSLITYFRTKKDLILLDCCGNDRLIAKPLKQQIEKYHRHSRQDRTCSSHSTLEKFISNLIYPGKVRAYKYLPSSGLSIYETSGYRYCENVGRCHKSNNVFWVVDLKNKTMYQKCQDQDCFGFYSKRRRLPVEICFQIDEDDDMMLYHAVEPESIAQNAASF